MLCPVEEGMREIPKVVTVALFLLMILNSAAAVSYTVSDEGNWSQGVFSDTVVFDYGLWLGTTWEVEGFENGVSAYWDVWGVPDIRSEKQFEGGYSVALHDWARVALNYSMPTVFELEAGKTFTTWALHNGSDGHLTHFRLYGPTGSGQISVDKGIDEVKCATEQQHGGRSAQTIYNGVQANTWYRYVLKVYPNDNTFYCEIQNQNGDALGGQNWSSTIDYTQIRLRDGGKPRYWSWFDQTTIPVYEQNGTYTHYLHADHEKDWRTLRVNVTQLPGVTDVDAVFRVRDRSGAVVDSQVVNLLNGTRNYTLSVSSSRNASLTFNGSTEDISRSWTIGSFTVFSENVSEEGDGAEEPVETIRPEDVIVLVNGTSNMSFVTSLGVDVVPVGTHRLNPPLKRGRTVFELGADETEHETVSRGGLLQRLNVSGEEVMCPQDDEKRLVAAMISALNASEAVCVSGDVGVIDRNLSVLQEEYIGAVRSAGDEVNHIVVATPAMSSVGAFLAADQHAFLTVVDEGGSGAVSGAIDEAAQFLAARDMYTKGAAQYTEGLYISLLGVPFLVREDPVEQGKWSLNDPKDGDTFHTDLPYGDLDGDHVLDAAVGRYPADDSLAALMYLRSKYYPDTKQALVASEYLHANWPVILAYVGGGMWSGKSMENILEDQGYGVQRSVEYRADPAGFLVSLTPASLQGVLDDSQSTGDKLGAVLGDSVGSAASQVLVYVKALHYVEQGLENYLEFDWSTLGFDVERAQGRLPGLNISDPQFVATTTEHALTKMDEEERLRDGVIEALKGEDLQMAIAQTVYAFLWPTRYDQISAEDLAFKMEDSSIVYYEGVGNGSAWFMPNNFSYLTGLKKIKTDRYTGTNNLMAEDMPVMEARIVFDNSDLSARYEVSRSQLWEEMLQKGSASFIGTSSVNYAPFSSEIDTRFFKHGYTVGQSLKNAVNSFSEDRLTWDPFNTVARDGVKQKMLRSFVLYGNPEQWKDPVIEDDIYRLETQCEDEDCTLTVSIDLNYSVQETNGTRMLDVDSNGQLLESFKPAIPLIKAKHALPSDTAVGDWNMTVDTRTLENVTVPAVEPLSHGGLTLNQSRNVSTDWFPANASRVSITEERDGRQQLTFVQAAFQYNESSHTARIYENVTLTLRYMTPFELSVDAEDGIAGDTHYIDVVLQNRAPTDITGDVLLRIGNGTSFTTRTVTRNFTKKAETHVAVPFIPMVADEYSVTAYFHGDEQVMGPRETSFTVQDPVELKRSLRINELLPDPEAGSEFVEIYNPTDYEVGVDRVRLEDEAGNEFAVTGTVDSNSFAVVTANSVLNNGGDTATLSYCPPNDEVDSFVYNDAGDGVAFLLANGTFSETAPTMQYDETVSGEHLRIVQVLPDADQDWDGDNVTTNDDDEFVMLYNPTDTGIDLGTYALVDADGHTEALQGTLAPNSSVVMFDPPSLNNGGDTVLLVRQRPCELIDSITYDSSAPNRSLGRYPDGGEQVVRMHPTPGEENTAVLATRSEVESLVLNELLPAPEDGTEFVELFNPTTEPIGLTGVSIEDAAGNEEQLSGVIDPHSYLVVETPPALNNDGDEVTVLFDGAVVSSYSYDDSTTGRAIGRSPDHRGRFTALPPTPGEQNPFIVTKTKRTPQRDRGSGSAIPVSMTKDSDVGKTGTFLQIDIPDEVTANVPFDVPILLNSTGFDTIYSYAYNGTTPVSMSLNRSQAWTGNAKPVEHGLQYVTLQSVIEPDRTGRFNFKIRARGNETEETYQTSIRVRSPPALAISRNASGNVSVSVSGACDGCHVRVKTPRNAFEGAEGTQYVRLDKTSGVHEAMLVKDGYVIDRQQFRVNGTREDIHSAVAERTGRDRMTGAVTASGSGFWTSIQDLLRLFIFW